jgi:hypothetical protein
LKVAASLKQRFCQVVEDYMEITGEIRMQAEQDIKRSVKIRKDLEVQI